MGRPKKKARDFILWLEKARDFMENVRLLFYFISMHGRKNKDTENTYY